MLHSAAGAWRTVSPMPFSRSDHTASTLDPLQLPLGAANPLARLVFIAGGCNGAQNCDKVSTYCTCSSVTRSFVAYDTLLDSYAPLPPMPTPRYRHLACTLDDVIYFFGGRELGTDAPISAVDAYNATARAWLPQGRLAPYPAALGSDNSCSTVGRAIFVFGGYSPFYDAAFNSTFSFSPGAAQGAGAWTRRGAQLRVGRGDFASVARPGARFVDVYGGYQASDFCTPLTSHEVYDAQADAFLPAAPLPSALAEKDDGVVLGGRLFSIGGETKAVASGCDDADILPHSWVYSYDPAADSWRTEAPMPDARMRFASAVVGETIFTFGGQGALVDGDFLPVLYTAWAFSVAGAGAGAGAAAAAKTFGVGDIVGAVLGTAASALVVAAALRSRQHLHSPAKGSELPLPLGARA